MDIQSIIVYSTCALGALALVAANWSKVSAWVPSMPSLSIGKAKATNDPTALIDAYNVARDACGEDAELGVNTDALFTALITKKVLRCEK